MKKFAWLCLSVTLLTVIILGVWGAFTLNNDVPQKGNAYLRFLRTTDDNAKKFNAWGIFSPLQVEKQKLDSATKTIHKRIYFPVSPKFILINTNEKWENYVVLEIIRVADSARKTVYDYHFDFDHTSKEVRKYAKPTELDVPDYVSYINLFGTASPESVKEGYEKSIYPGNFERENGHIARERSQSIAQKLETLGYTVGTVESSEIQLSKEDYWKALKDRTVLDKLRYVDVTINILYSKLEVETLTLPVLLPLWVLLVALGIGFLGNRNHLPAKLKGPALKKRRNPSSLLKGLIFVLGISLCILFWIFLFQKALIFALCIIVVFVTIFLLSCCKEALGTFFLLIWQFIKRLPGLVIIGVNNILFFLLVWLVIAILFVIVIFFELLDWWVTLTKCQKVLFFLIPYSIGITMLAAYLIHACPCW